MAQAREHKSRSVGARKVWKVVWRVLIRPTAAVNSRRTRTILNAAALVGSALLLVTALIHLHLWGAGYRRVPTIGNLFLMQAIAGVLLAGTTALVRRVATLLIAASFQLATAAGLLLSATVGIFGFQDGLDAPWARTSLLVEGLGAAILIATACILVLARPRREDLLSESLQVRAPGRSLHLIR
jgi:hypothetical protein